MKKVLAFLGICAIALCVPLTAFGATYSDQTYHLDEGQTVDEDLYVSGQNVYIDGLVEGNVFAVATNVSVTGEIKGTLYTGASSVRIDGKVERDVFAAGGTVDTSGEVGGATYLAGGMVNTGKNFTTGTDLFVGAGTAEILGKIGKNLVGGAGDMRVGSEVMGSAYLNVDNNNQANALTIQNSAQIQDNLEYKANQKAQIEKDAKIGGKTHYMPIPTQTKNVVKKEKTYEKGAAAAGGGFSMLAFFFGLVKLLGLIVVALVFVGVYKKKSQELHETFRGAYGASFGWGLIICILTPAVIFFLAITLVGFPLSMIILGLYLILLYLTKVVVGIHLGKLILEVLSKKKEHSMYLAALIGVFVVFILTIIPFIGWLIKALIAIWGIGIMYLYAQKKRKSSAKKPVAKTAPKSAAQKRPAKKKTSSKSKKKTKTSKTSKK